jgi:hypothetical protein
MRNHVIGAISVNSTNLKKVIIANSRVISFIAPKRSLTAAPPAGRVPNGAGGGALGSASEETYSTVPAAGSGADRTAAGGAVAGRSASLWGLTGGSVITTPPDTAAGIGSETGTATAAGAGAVSSAPASVPFTRRSISCTAVTVTLCKQANGRSSGEIIGQFRRQCNSLNEIGDDC